MKIAELAVNRNFLNPNFDGYKLSLDKLPTYSVSLDPGVDEAKLSDSQYSLQHIKAFGIHNHLIEDPWNIDTIFLVDRNWRICRFTAIIDGAPSPPVAILELPDRSAALSFKGRHNVTMSLPAEHWAVVADGAGSLLVYDTGKRTDGTNWTLRHRDTPLGDATPFIVTSSRLVTSDDVMTLHVVLLHVVQRERGSTDSVFVTLLTWLTMTSLDGVTWQAGRTHTLETRATPDYCALSTDGDTLLLSLTKSAHFVQDSTQEVATTEGNEHEEVGTGKEEEWADDDGKVEVPVYVWSQSESEVGVVFPVAEGVSKTDVDVRITARELQVSIKNRDTLLGGRLHSAVHVDESTWTLADNKLEVTLFKADGGTWPCVVDGDLRGVQEGEDPLPHLTSDSWNADPSASTQPAYNSEELEAVDACQDFTALQAFTAATRCCTHKVDLGGVQHLFTRTLSPSAPPSLCLRHDVDGLVWTLDPHTPCTWSHVGTFNALGYVSASKQQKKFASCSPDLSYAILVDCVRHAYIYRQPQPTQTPIHNRRTGQALASVAKQQLISLESTGDILGVYVGDEWAYLLADNTLYVIRVNVKEIAD